MARRKRQPISNWVDAKLAGGVAVLIPEIDCDVILAAQAMEMNAAVVTENVSHLSRSVEAFHRGKSA